MVDAAINKLLTEVTVDEHLSSKGVFSRQESKKVKINSLLNESLKSIKEGLSDEVESAMVDDIQARGFNRVHGQILNGGFAQLYGNSRGDVSDIIKQAKWFVSQYAPDFSKTFNGLMVSYMAALDQYGEPEKRDSYGNLVDNNRLIDAWSEIDDEYYDFYENMEDAIEQGYRAKVVV